MTALYDDVIDTAEQARELARRLERSPPRDEHGRGLRVRIERVAQVAAPGLRIRLCKLCEDIAKQVVLDGDGEYRHIDAVVGSSVARWMTDKQWRGLFSAIGCRADMVPDPEHYGLIVLMESSKSLTDGQCRAAIAAAMAFGSQRGVRWTQPPQQE